MDFIEHRVKGLRRMLVAEGIDPRRLHVRLSEIGPGTRAHPIGPEKHIVLDATREHGLVNTGPGRLRYLAITAP
jgi:hypothetical protein